MLFHFVRFLINLEPPDSQATFKELVRLLEYSSPGKLVAEIGCYERHTN
jgi:hypothetical protein